jgi:hypothetical protein
LTFSTASAAVALQMPAEQIMFCVGAFEIASAAFAAGEAISTITSPATVWRNVAAPIAAADWR